MALFSFFYLFLLGFIALFPDLSARFPFDEQNVDRLLLPPNSINWFGTDNLGRDLASRVIFGARVSLSIAVLTTLATVFIGIVLGAAAGFYGGFLDSLIMRGVDVLQSIPTLVLMILVSIIFNAKLQFESDEVRSVISMFLSLSLVGWVRMARLVRGQVIQLKEMAFVEAATAAGATDFVILWKHILPQTWGSVIALVTLQIPSQILNESFLSFVGLGLQPPYSSWGVLASEGWRSFRVYPHLILFPGGAIFLTMLIFNYLGDQLRNYFGPRKLA